MMGSSVAQTHRLGHARPQVAEHTLVIAGGAVEQGEQAVACMHGKSWLGDISPPTMPTHTCQRKLGPASWVVSCHCEKSDSRMPVSRLKFERVSLSKALMRLANSSTRSCVGDEDGSVVW